MGIKRWFNGAKLSAKAKLDKHYGEPLRNRREAKGYLDAAVDKGNAAEAAKWRKIRNQQTRKLARNVAIPVGAYGAARIAGAGVAGVATAGKRGVQAVKRSLSWNVYDTMIILMALFYFTMGPFYRANLAIMISFYVAITLFVFLAVLAPSEKNPETAALIFMIWAIEVFLPWIVYSTDFLSANRFVVDYLINPQITLMWLYFAIFRSPRNTIISKIAFWAVWIIWTGIAFSLVYSTYDFEDITTPLTADQIAKAESIYKRAGVWWIDVFANYKKVIAQGTDYFRHKFIYATGGDIYSGQVDEGQSEILGVYLKDLKPADPEFYQGETINVWALIEANTLEDGLTINLSCFHGKKNSKGSFSKEQKGAVEPEDIPFIYDQETVDVDCKFLDSYVFDDGTNKVTVRAEFNFETLAYLKTYFMDQDRVRSLVRQGINPLEHYTITDTNPVAKYTNGPVRIGMGSSQPPVGIVDSISVKPRLGITLDTNTGWKGKVKEMLDLIVMVPKPMTLDTVWCTEFKPFTEAEYVDNCTKKYKKFRSKQFLECVEDAGLDRETGINSDNSLKDDSKTDEVATCMETACQKEIEGYNAYSLVLDQYTKPLYTNFGFDASEKKYKTFSCRVNINNANELLGDLPVSVQYYRVKARYRYQIEEDVSVNVEERDPEIIDPNRPRPPTTGKAQDQISYIFDQYYKQTPYIKQYCEESKLRGKPDECACLVMSVIAQESNGDVNVKSGDGGKSHGLMQIMDATAKGVWEQTAAERCNLRDAGCNIRTGIYYLSLIEKKATDLEPQDIAAGHNCGEKAVTSVDCKGEKKLLWECDKDDFEADSKCVVPKTGAQTKDFYIPSVMKRYEVCIDMDLMNTAVEKPPTEGEIPKTASIQFEPGAIISDKKRIDGTNYWVSLQKSGDDILSAFEYFSAIYYGKNDPDYKLSKTIQLSPGGPVLHDPKYPLFKLKLLEGDKIDVTYLEKADSELVNLIKDAKKTSDHEQVKDMKSIFGGWMYVWYDGDINLYDSTRQKFCTVDWSTYSNRESGFCEDSDLFTVRVININTYDKTSIETTPEEERAIVQVQIDLNKVHDCCKDCSCDSTNNDELYCNSCPQCSPVPNLGLYFKCEEGLIPEGLTETLPPVLS